MTPLRSLDHAVGRLVTDPAFRAGRQEINIADYERPFPADRSVDGVNACLVIDEARRLYPDDPPASDAWLAPRLHSALRLTRREAAERGVWRYLGVVEFPNYVRWRWSNATRFGADAAATADRFVGPDYKHALARLWWMAELFRDGSDYEPSVFAMTIQDISNNLFRMDIAHHRPTVQAALRVLNRPDEGLSTGRHANALAKATNAAATTLVIDVIAPDPALDSDARLRWIQAGDDHDPRLYFDELPVGPDDPPVPPGSIEVMCRLLSELLSEAPIRGRAHTKEPET